jgi:putative membrane protein
MGLILKNSGLVPTEYLMLPIFIGLYGFSSIISKKYEKIEVINEIGMMEKMRLVLIAFISSMFASLISGMKRGQASALALQLGNITQREEVLFILPAISLAFTTLSIFVLFSIGKVRSSLAYDVWEVMGEIYFPQTILFVSVIAVSACISAFILILLAKPLGGLLSKINSKYLKIFGFCIGCLLIINFTGIQGMLVAFTSTSIGILSSRFHIRSTHLMGVLLLPSIVSMIL